MTCDIGIKQFSNRLCISEKLRRKMIQKPLLIGCEGIAKVLSPIVLL